jgi:hypothetical protein
MFYGEYKTDYRRTQMAEPYPFMKQYWSLYLVQDRTCYYPTVGCVSGVKGCTQSPSRPVTSSFLRHNNFLLNGDQRTLSYSVSPMRTVSAALKLACSSGTWATTLPTQRPAKLPNLIFIVVPHQSRLRQKNGVRLTACRNDGGELEYKSTYF